MLPQGYLYCSGPVAAHSHSASVGSLLPTYAQYARALSQLTRFTGWSGKLGYMENGSFVQGSSHRPAETHARYARTVTSSTSRQKGSESTTTCSPSRPFIMRNPSGPVAGIAMEPSGHAAPPSLSASVSRGPASLDASTEDASNAVPPSASASELSAREEGPWPASASA